MLNIALPIASKPANFNDYPYPLPLIEIAGVPMIQRVVENLKLIKGDIHFIFVVLKEDCMRYHLDNTLKLITGNNCTVVQLEKPTKGAACSLLMAINAFHNDNPLLIVNSDQLFEADLNQHLDFFAEKKADAGCIIFNSVHPRWSYVKLNVNEIVEAAEKNPISNNAIAGLYYYRKGELFTRAAMEMIRKEVSVNDLYYVAPTLNELILDDATLIASRINNENYFSFYTSQRIADYELRLISRNKS